MTFGEVVAYFKTKETDVVENIAPLIDDADLRNALVAWKSVTIKYSDMTECKFTEETSQWNWLWQQIQYDQEMFGTVAGIKAANVGSVITRLIGLRLIYPDGTANSMARQYLQQLILQKLSPKRPGRPRKEQTSSESAKDAPPESSKES